MLDKLLGTQFLLMYLLAPPILVVLATVFIKTLRKKLVHYQLCLQACSVAFFLGISSNVTVVAVNGSRMPFLVSDSFITLRLDVFPPRYDMNCPYRPKWNGPLNYEIKCENTGDTGSEGKHYIPIDTDKTKLLLLSDVVPVIPPFMSCWGGPGLMSLGDTFIVGAFFLYLVFATAEGLQQFDQMRTISRNKSAS